MIFAAKGSFKKTGNGALLILLIHPPTSKPSEPPPGIAAISGCLDAHNHDYYCVDLNIEGVQYLLNTSQGASDRWSQRAVKNRYPNLAAIRDPELYTNYSRYRKCVFELNRLLQTIGDNSSTLSLANFSHSTLSPQKSRDLLHIYNHPEHSIFYGFFHKRISDLIDEHSPTMIGISLNYLSQALHTFTLLGIIDRLLPSVKTIVGGGLITSWMRSQQWHNNFSGIIDHCICGDGESPTLALFGDTIRKHWQPDFSRLPLSDYMAPGLTLPFSGSRGCYWNKCRFCPEVAENTPFHNIAPADSICSLNTLVNRYRPSLIHFLDNGIPPGLLRALIDSPPGVPWYGFARISDQLTRYDFCVGLKQSGCVMLKLGIESGSQHVLDKLNKGIQLAAASKALHNLRAAGIATYVYLLFGTPAESYEDACMTRDFIEAHHQYITYLNLAIFNMPISTSHQYNLATTPFYDGDLALYTEFEHPMGWNRSMVRKFLSKDFRKHPVIAPILQRDPPLFTSNHASFFGNAQ